MSVKLPTSATAIVPVQPTLSVLPNTSLTFQVPALTIVALKKPTVWTWGSDSAGGLGTGGGPGVNIPQQLSLNDVQSISIFGHVLAVKSDGTVWGWGQNEQNQLGTLAAPGGIVTVPTQIPGLSNIKAVAAGVSHSLALDGNGQVWSWGYNGVGQLGNGTISQTRVATPAKIDGLSGVVAIAAGYAHSLALKSDGSVWAWGYNYHGELGVGSTENYGLPVKVTGLSSIATISVSWNHSLALRSDGSLYSWGENVYGQVGNGGTNNCLTPVLLPTLKEIKSIAAGWSHSLALAADGTLWAWGANNSGQLGIGTTTNAPIASPVKATVITGISRLAAGPDNSFAIKTDGTLWGWGGNTDGQLGVGHNNGSVLPLQASKLTGVVSVAMGHYQGDKAAFFAVALCQ